jgi:uncharacterized protein YcbK (DUF882 family)
MPTLADGEVAYACRCGCGFKDVSLRLIVALHRLCDILGVPPEKMEINCICRCHRHNAVVGGEVRSHHCTDALIRRDCSEAADIKVEGITPASVADAAERIPDFRGGGIGRYKTFTHVDTRPNGPARWP